jgi:hypothetical protein
MRQPSGFLTYTPWQGQLNNTRMCFETALVFALVANRRLVIPKGYRQNGQPEVLNGVFRPLHPSEFLDLRSITEIIDIIPYREYSSLRLSGKPANLAFGVNTAVFCHPHVPHSSSRAHSELVQFASGRTHFLEFTEAMKKCITINISNPMLEHFYSFFFFLDPKERLQCKSFVRDRIKFKPEILNAAEIICRHLGLFSALHVRRGDFVKQYPSQDISANRMLLNIIRYIPQGTTLYVSTDETNRDFFAPFKKYYDILFFSDVFGFIERMPLSHSIACIEQIICSRASEFIGTRLSTFSGYITRLRGYRRLHNADIHFTDGYEPNQSKNGKERFSWTPWLRNGNPLWGREYREGWEL